MWLRFGYGWLTFLAEKSSYVSSTSCKTPLNSSFFCRTFIPFDIRDLFGGTIEFRVSLKCVSKVESKKVCLQLNKQIETIYKQIRMGKSLTIEEMKRMLKKEIEKSKKHSSYFSYVGVDRSKEKKKQECLETLWRQNQLMNKELISKKRNTIYQNRIDTTTR